MNTPFRSKCKINRSCVKLCEMDSCNFEKYNKYKSKVKLWERNFKTKSGRIPSKYDIKEAPKDVKEAYKMYYKLKTALLETTLGEVFCEDGYEVLFSEDSQTENVIALPNLSINDSECSNDTKFIAALTVDKEETTSKLKNIDTTKINSMAWKNVKKKKEVEKVEVSSQSNTSFQMNTNLFSSCFTKRNPRKTLKRKNSKITEGNNVKENDHSSEPKLLDLETVLSVKLQQKPKESKSHLFSKDIGRNVSKLWENSSNTNNLFKTLNVESSKIDKQWLEKNLLSNSIIDESISRKEVTIDSSSDSVVSNSEDESSHKEKHIYLDHRVEPDTIPILKEKKNHGNNNKIDVISPRKMNIEQKLEKLSYWDDEHQNKNSKSPICFDVPNDNNSCSTFDINDKSTLKNASPAKEPSKLVSKKTKSNFGGTSGNNLLQENRNQNFIRLNLKKKIYVRGKKTISYSKYKKSQWKLKRNRLISGNNMDIRDCDDILTCFSCGQTGHFAGKCQMKFDKLLPIEVTVDDSPFSNIQTVSEMEINKIEKDIENSNKKDKIEEKSMKKISNNQIPESFLEKCNLTEEFKPDECLSPLYSFKEENSKVVVPKEVQETLHLFGYANFRKGQDRAIMRILSGISTLVTLSTGSGKSLCYQLPAYLYSRRYKCITLVVSPLVSLMEDQVFGVPKFLNAQCLHTNQTPTQKKKILEMINLRKVDILLISPEALVSYDNSSLYKTLFRSLPSIAFACIDEAHCVSQWSHNFRPSYLMVCKVLKKNLGVKTILGLTATATFQTRKSIIKHIDIKDGEDGVISDIPIPENLILTVSKDQNRDQALISLLKSERFNNCHSIIIYCTKRNECERIAEYIRTVLQDTRINEKETKKRKRTHWIAEAYHAGLSASRRRTLQKAFMSNELKIVVATIAFGMGINKTDIRAIIHYNIPSCFENYVQEVGRAGRDGNASQCHTFLDSKGLDSFELKRHIYANSIDRQTIRKLLEKVFIHCSCNNKTQRTDKIELCQVNESEGNNGLKSICPGHEVGIPIDSTVSALDIPEENISTLLCYLELHSKWNIELLGNAYLTCKIVSYVGPRGLEQAAKHCPPLAMAISLKKQENRFDETSNIIEFDIIRIASTIGLNSGAVKYQLKNLECKLENGTRKRSALTVSFSELGFRIKAPGDLSESELDDALEILYTRTQKQEQTQLAQLHFIIDGLSSISFDSVVSCKEKIDILRRSDELKTLIRDYFENKCVVNANADTKCEPINDNQIVSDIYAILSMYPKSNFTGRAIARIFQGIQSPNYPAAIWGKCKFWRSYYTMDFNEIVDIVNRNLVKVRS